MLYDCKRISYWIDRRLSGLAGPDYDATISFGLPLEPEDSQYGKSWLMTLREEAKSHLDLTGVSLCRRVDSRVASNSIKTGAV